MEFCVFNIHCTFLVAFLAESLVLFDKLQSLALWLQDAEVIFAVTLPAAARGNTEENMEFICKFGPVYCDHMCR